MHVAARRSASGVNTHHLLGYAPWLWLCAVRERTECAALLFCWALVLCAERYRKLAVHHSAVHGCGK